MCRPPPLSRWTSPLLLLLVVVGLSVRLHEAASGRWAWFDEASVGNFLHDNSLGQLPVARGFRMVQPLFFSWAAKLFALAAGSYREWVLRLPALISGLLTLGGTALLARRVLGPWGAVTTTGLVALSTLLTYYAWEIKPYSLDATVALAVLATALLPAGPGLLRPLPRAILVASFAPWWSLPSVFMLPGLLYDAYRRDDTRRRGLLGGLLLLLLVSAALNLAWALAVKEDMGGFLNDYWRSGYPPYAEGAGAIAAWALRMGEGFLRHLLDLGSVWPLGALLALVGLEASRRDEGRLARLAGGTLVFLAAASALEVYPVSTHPWLLNNRLCLYLIPVLAFLIGAGVDAVGRTRAAALAPALTAVLLTTVGARLWEPLPDLSNSDRLERILAEARPSDAIGLGPSLMVLWRYHENSGRFRAHAERPAPQLAGNWASLEEPVPAFPPAVRRVWWIEPGGEAVRSTVWEEHLKAAFVPAETQPPEEGLSLWVRPEAAPGSPPRP